MKIVWRKVMNVKIVKKTKKYNKDKEILKKIYETKKKYVNGKETYK